MPRSCSICIQSDTASRPALPDFTEPARWIAPEYSSSFSVSVVLPASGCEMMPKVRRRSASCARSIVGSQILKGASPNHFRSRQAAPTPQRRSPPGCSVAVAHTG